MIFLKNYKIVIQYEGTKYQGWQKQVSTDNTLQGKFESILSKMCHTKVEISASGRTDAGVHAKGQVANFHIDSPKSPEEIKEYINQYLPGDVAVIDIVEVPERFHSRLNAKKKIYCYRVWNSNTPNVFLRRYVYELNQTLDIDAMMKAAAYLCGTHDFKSFTSAKKGKKSTVRTIESIKIEIEKEEIRFTFKGNGFLYHMVRILMGTLLEVGMGKKNPADIPLILESKERQKAGPLVPAKGLMLEKVEY